MNEFNRRKAIKQHIERDPFAKMLGATVEAIEVLPNTPHPFQKVDLSYLTQAVDTFFSQG